MSPLEPIRLSPPVSVPVPLQTMAIVGAGNIVRIGHLPGYRAHGIPVAAIYDPDPAALAAAAQIYPGIPVAASFDEILADPGIAIVDITTHVAIRPELVERAIEAGKHVLSQKPFAESVATARHLVELARNRGVALAVNQNGRHAPAFNGATELIRRGAIGEVMAISHTFEKPEWWTPGTVFDRMDHCGIYDYAIHWIDISRVWFGGETPIEVRARDFRTPGQPADSHTPWGFWIELVFADGRTSMIRGVGVAKVERAGHPFTIYGSEGVIRGVELGDSALALVRDGTVTRFALEGQWFPDAFAGTLAELMSAVNDGREPHHSGRDNLGTIAATLAAVRSAEQDGAAVAIESGE